MSSDADRKYRSGEKVTRIGRYKWYMHTNDSICKKGHTRQVIELDDSDRFPTHTACRQPCLWEIE